MPTKLLESVPAETKAKLEHLSIYFRHDDDWRETVRPWTGLEAQLQKCPNLRFLAVEDMPSVASLPDRLETLRVGCPSTVTGINRRLPTWTQAILHKVKHSTSSWSQLIVEMEDVHQDDDPEDSDDDSLDIDAESISALYREEIMEDSREPDATDFSELEERYAIFTATAAHAGVSVRGDLAGCVEEKLARARILLKTEQMNETASDDEADDVVIEE